jgi:serine/threonine protein kinase
MMEAAAEQAPELAGTPYANLAKDSNILAANDALPAAMRRSMWSVKDFHLLKCLHKGYASHVYSATCKLSGAYIVLKVYNLSVQCDLQRVQLYREICVHSRLQHPNVVQFYAAFLVSAQLCAYRGRAVVCVRTLMRRMPLMRDWAVIMTWCVAWQQISM